MTNHGLLEETNILHVRWISVKREPWLNVILTGGSAQDAVWEPTPLSDGEVFPKTPQALVQDTVVHAATGRHHTILVTASGDAYVAGQNHLGQAATENGLRDVPCFNKVNINGDKVVSASAGVSFSLFLTDKGQVWAVGKPDSSRVPRTSISIAHPPQPRRRREGTAWSWQGQFLVLGLMIVCTS